MGTEPWMKGHRKYEMWIALRWWPGIRGHRRASTASVTYDWTVKAHTLIWAVYTPTAMISQFLWLGSVQPSLVEVSSGQTPGSAGLQTHLGVWASWAGTREFFAWGSGAPASVLAARQGPTQLSRTPQGCLSGVAFSRAGQLEFEVIRGSFWFCSEGVWIYIKSSRRRLCHRSPRHYPKQRWLSVNTPAVGNTMTSHGRDRWRN